MLKLLLLLFCQLFTAVIMTKIHWPYLHRNQPNHAVSYRKTKYFNKYSRFTHDTIDHSIGAILCNSSLEFNYQHLKHVSSFQIHSSFGSILVGSVTYAILVGSVTYARTAKYRTR